MIEPAKARTNYKFQLQFDQIPKKIANEIQSSEAQIQVGGSYFLVMISRRDGKKEIRYVYSAQNLGQS